jgi:hypothetical protein
MRVSYLMSGVIMGRSVRPNERSEQHREARWKRAGGRLAAILVFGALGRPTPLLEQRRVTSEPPNGPSHHHHRRRHRRHHLPRTRPLRLTAKSLGECNMYNIFFGAPRFLSSFFVAAFLPSETFGSLMVSK